MGVSSVEFLVNKSLHRYLVKTFVKIYVSG